MVRNITINYFSLGHAKTFVKLSKAMVGGRATRISDVSKALDRTPTFTIASHTGNVFTEGNVDAKGSVVLGSDSSDSVTFNGVIMKPVPFEFDGNPSDSFTTKLHIADAT